ncbi:MAG: acyl-CoA thioesterase [Vicinamibacteria bacterium]|nr:acyl-CoA thioesterase [Vicinamibacteria bacterium]
MSARSAVSQLRVRYAETDQMGVAWHGGYLAWFEVARTDLLRGFGTTYKEMEAQGLRLPVIAAQARYLKPALYDDVLNVTVRIAQLTRVRMAFDYEVRRDGEQVVLATGRTEHAVVDLRGRPCRLPEPLRQVLA